MDSLKRDVIVNVSSSACARPISGHPYWFHKELSSASLEGVASVQTIGSKIESAPWIAGLLSHGGNTRPASTLFPNWGMASDVRAIQCFAKKNDGQVILHVYEGGFREFLLVVKLLKENQDWLGVFNFNFADPWHLAFSRQGFLARQAQRRVARTIESLGQRLIPLAETEALADLFSSRVGKTFKSYPLFSILGEKASRPAISFEERDIDVCFFPANLSEAHLVLSAIKDCEKNLEVRLAKRLIPRWGFEISEEQLTELGLDKKDYVQGVLGADEYLAQYEHAKVSVFPYLDPVYLFASSGRVLDAAAMGSICLAPQGTQPGSVVEKEGLGTTFSFDNLSQALFTALSRGGQSISRVRSSTEALKKLIEITHSRDISFSKAVPSPTLTFAVVYFSTGFRDWAPRLVGGLRNLWLTLSAGRS